MRKFQIPVAVIVTFVILVFVYSSQKSQEKEQSPSTDQAFEQQEAIRTEILESDIDFPLFFGETHERTYSKNEEGYEITSIIGDSVDTIIFWYYDEFLEEGWEIVNEPDTSNSEYQEIRAVNMDGTKAFVSATSENGNTKLFIKINK